MNSASILMDPAAAVAVASAAAGTEQAPATTGGFDQALAAALSQFGADDVPTEPAALELVSDVLVRSAAPVGQRCLGDASVSEKDIDTDAQAATDAIQSGAAAILAQMLAGTSPPIRPENPPVADAAARVDAAVQVDAAAQVIVSPPAASTARRANAGATAAYDATEPEEDIGRTDSADAGKYADLAVSPIDSTAAESLQPDATALSDKPATLPAIPAPPSQAAPQAGSPAQAAIQAAASALRDAAPAAAASSPSHATLREPVGTARWADELGNRLVMMSVRGQQHGSLTLTPEHLGPVEVQISMNRDTANVWFGAQHADTRAALAEAMPRLREMLASSGLSLGQSGVSEQAPREHLSPPPSLAGTGSEGVDANAVVEKSAPAWRVWRPGLIDTYA